MHSTRRRMRINIIRPLCLHLRLDQAKGNWSDLAAKFAFAHNTTINASTGLTPYEIVFGQKPQIPISLKLGLLRNSELTCNSEFCANLPLHRHSLQHHQIKLYKHY